MLRIIRIRNTDDRYLWGLLECCREFIRQLGVKVVKTVKTPSKYVLLIFFVGDGGTK
jgi:hypothetical protein